MFTQIINPTNNKSYSIFSSEGSNLLKSYVKNFNGGSQNSTQSTIEELKRQIQVLNEKLQSELKKEELEKTRKKDELEEKTRKKVELEEKISSIKGNIRYLDGRLSDASRATGHWSGRMEYDMLKSQIENETRELEKLEEELKNLS